MNKRQYQKRKKIQFPNGDQTHDPPDTILSYYNCGNKVKKKWTYSNNVSYYQCFLSLLFISIQIVDAR